MWLDRFLSNDQKRRRLLRQAPPGPLSEYLQKPFIDSASKLEAVEFLALDLEATGLDIDHDEILSVGFTVIRQLNIQLSECDYFLVRPQQAIPEQTAVLHGIMDDASAQGLALDEAMGRILSALQGRVLLAHHASIECGFINAACRRLYGSEAVFPLVDTYAIEYTSLKHRGITPENNGLRLYNLREDYGLPRYPAHNALSDAVSAAELFLAQVAHRQGRSSMKLKEVMTRC